MISPTAHIFRKKLIRKPPFWAPSSTSAGSTSYASSPSISYRIYSIWLFTFSDIKTIIAPSFAFGFFTAYISPSFDIHPAPTWQELIQRAPLMLLWSWINLLPFAIDNQRRPESIAEDTLNKPWRTLPAKRMTPQQAFNLMLVFYPLAILTSLQIGGLRQCIGLVVLGIWYNNFGGADASWITRNFINGCGFVCHISAPLEVALGGQQVASNESTIKWLLIIGTVVFTTVQTQDMYDQAGDCLHGRKSLPLVVGDGPARWSIAVPMTFWCIFCPWYWSSSPITWTLVVSLGLTVAGRSLALRSVSQDRATFRLWNLWMVCLYALPLTRVVY
ncbi:uncharacterized protein GIQ15_06285 [Arthroderma uncinatum]|uniref:uncharacterized protein n=1 Tax=Arthroderma uncinatum TaxID=74035 RepID=UPI00144A9A63|nr:uncharacterized protein GIQ15_06285 [Arthroderma uncinatum]KAF3480938.1 hypothetical protein GIQ15_06285 [Arthroderma uncinatum]